jgi:hypothetical protein
MNAKDKDGHTARSLAYNKHHVRTVTLLDNAVFIYRRMSGKLIGCLHGVHCTCTILELGTLILYISNVRHMYSMTGFNCSASCSVKFTTFTVRFVMDAR